MNDAQLLERLTLTDPCPPDRGAPPRSVDATIAWAQVERLVRAPQSPPQRRGWLVAAAVFAAVMLVGIGVTLLTRATVDEAPVTNTTLPPSTTAPPTTEASAVPLPPEQLVPLSDFVAAYARGDAEAALAFFAPGATVDLAPFVDADASSSAELVVDRIETGTLFEETVELGECVQLDEEIQCAVAIEDLFTAHLRLDPSVQTWVLEFADGLIASLRVDGESGPRSAAMATYDQWLRARGFAGILAGDAEWVRTEATATLLQEQLVEYGALASGVSAEDWAIISSFYERLSAEDAAGALALFAPGGTYDLAENDDTSAAPVLERGGPVANPDIRQQFVWWYDSMKVDWRPIRCVAGDAAGEVRCRSEEMGVTTLDLPGGRAEGLVVFTVAGDGIRSVIDHTLRGTQLRDWWRDWMELNAPQYVDVWLTPTGPGQGNAPMTTDFANVTLELYPVYLASRGVDVPPEYLDGSLLPEDWEPRPAP